MRFLFKILWPKGTVSPVEVRTALSDLNDSYKRLLLKADTASKEDVLIGLMFETETLSEGSMLCVQAKGWLADKYASATLRVHERGWHTDCDLLLFLVHNLTWTASEVKSVIRVLKGKRGTRPNKAARDARFDLEKFLERNG